MADLALEIELKAFDRASKTFRNLRRAGGKLGKQFEANRKKLAAMQKTLDNVAAFKKARTALTHNSRALATMREKAARLEKQLGNTSGTARSIRATERLRREFARTRTSVTRLESSQQRCLIRVGTLRKRLAAAGLSSKDFAGKTARLRRESEGLNRVLGTQAERLGTLTRNQRRLDNLRARRKRLLGKTALVGAAGTAAMVGGRRMLGGIATLLAPGADFGFEVDRAAALSGVGKGSAPYTLLRRQALTLGAKTQYHATDVAKGQQFLAMAGFTPESIAAAMPSVLDLATVGKLDVPRTANIASNILSGFKLPARDMAKVADVLSATITRTNTDIEMLGDTMKYVAPAAQQAGASLAETAAMAGLLGNIAIQGDMSGTALRNLYNRLANPPGAAGKALEALQIQTQDAHNNLRPLPAILAEVARKTAHLGSATRLGYFQAIAGARAGSAMAALVDKAGSGGITRFADVLNSESGIARRKARAMYDNAYGDIIRLGSAWESLRIGLFSTTDSPIRALIQSLTKLVTRIGDWSRKNPRLTATLLEVGAGLAALVAAGGALLMLFAGIAGPMLLFSGALAALSTLAGTLAGALAALSTFAGAVSLPLLAVVAAVSTLGAAAWLLYRNWARVVAWVKGLWQHFAAWIGGIGQAIVAAIGNWSVTRAVRDAFSAAIAWVDDKLAWLRDKWTAFKRTIGIEEKNIMKKMGAPKKIHSFAQARKAERVMRQTPRQLLDSYKVGGTRMDMIRADRQIMAIIHNTAKTGTVPIAGSVSNDYRIDITVAGSADSDTAAEIGQAVRRELDAREQERAAARRSALYD